MGVFIIGITPSYKEIIRFCSDKILIRNGINQIVIYQICKNIIFNAISDSFKVWYLITIKFTGIVYFYSFYT